MTRTVHNAKKHMLSAAISVAMVPFSFNNVSAQSQSDSEIEQIIVTGSLIRRTDGFTAASPVTSLTSEDIAMEGTVNMGDVVRNSTFNYGSSTTGTIQGTSDQNTGFNLRGLGRSATLVLMDSMRTPTENVNAFLPTIAIQRLDILKDGSAQQYGADAVAGVVNYIPYRSYDGFEMEYFRESDTGKGDFSDQSFQFLTGTDINENINVVVAASVRDQGTLRWIDRPDLMKAGLTFSGNGNPGNFTVPQRDQNGKLTGNSVSMPDPNCSPTREDPAQLNANPNGFLFGGRCWIDFGDGRSYRNEQTQQSYYTNVNWDVMPTLRLRAQFNYNRIQASPRGSIAGSATNFSNIPDVSGDHPGNPFRAVSADGRQLFGQPRRDVNGSIVTDSLGRPLVLRENGQAVLAQNQFVSIDDDPLGGVPFRENVRPGSWRTLGKSHGILHGRTGIHNPDNSMAQDNDDRNWRMALNAEFDVPYIEEWLGSLSYAYMRSTDMDQQTRSFSTKAIRQGLGCDPTLDIANCFNPFAPIPGMPETVMSDAVLGSIATTFRELNENELQTMDLVFSGPLPLDLPGGEIGMAAGYQRREEHMSVRPGDGVITGDAFTASQQGSYSFSRFVNAGFLEVLFPVLPNLEVNAAVREETFSTGQSALVDKYGIIYEPLDWLGLRATVGEAFVAPTLNQLRAPESCGSDDLDDPFTSFAGFIFTCNQGNPDLIPETSDTISAGIDLMPIDGLTISASWSETDFNNRIVGTNIEELIQQDFFNFQEATGFQPTDEIPFPSEEAVSQWEMDSRSEPRIIRDPNNMRRFVRVTTGDSNASSVLVRSWDLEIDYSTEIRSYGVFGLNLQGTVMDDFLYQEFPDRPVSQGVGAQNDFTGTAPALPEYKANARFTWTRGSHLVNITGRFVDDVIFDASDFSFQRNIPHSNFRFVNKIDAWSQMDVSYSYRDLQTPLIGGLTTFTVGSRNVFDRRAQKVGMTSGIVGELQDPLGRIVYGRMNYKF